MEEKKPLFDLAMRELLEFRRHMWLYILSEILEKILDSRLNDWLEGIGLEEQGGLRKRL